MGYKPRWRANLGCVSITVILAIFLCIAFACAVVASYNVAFYEYNTIEDEQALLDFQFGVRSAARSRANQNAFARFWEQQTSDFAESVVDRIIVTDNFELLRFMCSHGMQNEQQMLESFAACERAAELNPEDAVLRDYRGLGRLFEDETEAAIEDFEYYVDWLQTSDMDEALIINRNEWLAELVEHDRRLSCRWNISPFYNRLMFTNPETIIELPCRFVDRQE